MTERAAPWRGDAERLRWREALDSLAVRYNREALLETDPVVFLHRSRVPKEIEVLGLLSSALAFGGVRQIQRSIEATLRSAEDLRDPAEVRGALMNLRHRWATGDDLTVLLVGARELQSRHGNLETAFLAHDVLGPDYTRALTGLREELLDAGRAATGLVRGQALLPDPAGGSAAKRWHLMLRWFVRGDAVDRGIWTRCVPGRLLMPLDTHIFRIAGRMGLTLRRTPGLAAAREITERLRELDPADPVRWDFGLTRLGMLDICGAGTPTCDECPLRRVCPGAQTRKEGPWTTPDS